MYSPLFFIHYSLLRPLIVCVCTSMYRTQITEQTPKKNGRVVLDYSRNSLPASPTNMNIHDFQVAS